MIIEVCKKNDPYLKKYYNNDPLAMVKAGDGLLWDNDRIRSAFNFGRGTEKDLYRYMNDNKMFCAFYDTEKRCFC
jgi:hypothetical protein